MFTPHVRPARQRLRDRRRRSFPALAGTVAASVLALVLALPGTAAAAPGGLDAAFSGDGTVLTSLTGNDTANGGLNTDTCTTDVGDTRLSCP
ncbi:hypothetical protein ACWCQQ_47835 [Streptomyces sp. NPDC002143]